jgi:flagellar basal body-associated protein FliL
MQTRALQKPGKLKRMLIMIGLVLLLIAAIVGIKWWTISTMIAGMKPQAPTVTTSAAARQQPALGAVGTLRRVRR